MLYLIEYLGVWGFCLGKTRHLKIHSTTKYCIQTENVPHRLPVSELQVFKVRPCVSHLSSYATLSTWPHGSHPNEECLVHLPVCLGNFYLCHSINSYQFIFSKWGSYSQSNYKVAFSVLVESGEIN